MLNLSNINKKGKGNFSNMLSELRNEYTKKKTDVWGKAKNPVRWKKNLFKTAADNGHATVEYTIATRGNKTWSWDF